MWSALNRRSCLFYEGLILMATAESASKSSSRAWNPVWPFSKSVCPLENYKDQNQEHVNLHASPFSVHQNQRANSAPSLPVTLVDPQGDAIRSSDKPTVEKQLDPTATTSLKTQMAWMSLKFKGLPSRKDPHAGALTVQVNLIYMPPNHPQKNHPIDLVVTQETTISANPWT